MCKFCEKIFNLRVIEKLDFIEQSSFPSAILVQEKDKQHIYSFCEDNYYNGILIRDVNYCPICGRELLTFAHLPEEKWIFTIDIPDIKEAN